MLSLFPHLSEPEFEQGCAFLLERFRQCEQKQEAWISVETICQHGLKYLRITRALHCTNDALQGCEDGDGLDELDDDGDDEVILKGVAPQAVIYYDILLSPTYRVPVLYIRISDPLLRFPPTMATLYEHLIPPHFKPETENVGIIGAITITNHPATNRPVFFIHPCQTAGVMEVTVGSRAVTAGEYLMVWIGALGKYVGLDMPMSLVQGRPVN